MFRPVPSFVHHRALELDEFRVGIPTRSIDSEFAFRVYMYRIQCIRIKRFRTGSETAGFIGRVILSIKQPFCHAF